MNIGVHLSFNITVLDILDVYLGVKLLSHKVVLFLVF